MDMDSDSDPDVQLFMTMTMPMTMIPPTSRTPVSFTAEKIGALRAQIYTFKLIIRGQPVPEHIQTLLPSTKQITPKAIFSRTTSTLEYTPTMLIDIPSHISSGPWILISSLLAFNDSLLPQLCQWDLMHTK